jgi:hypothetical protein
LLTDVAPVALELGLIAEERVSVDGSIVEPIALTRIHKLIVNGQRVHAGCVRDKIRGYILSRASRLGIKGLKTTHVILRVC